MIDGCVLVVEDDKLMARALATRIGRSLNARVAGSLAEAREACNSTAILGVVLDHRLPDGLGLDWLADLRMRDRQLPVLVCTGYMDDLLELRASSLRANAVQKTQIGRALDTFLVRLAARRHIEDQSLAAALGTYALERGLTVRQTEMLALSIVGTSQDDIMRILDIAEGTFRTHRRELLARLGAKSLKGAAAKFLRDHASPPLAD